jgi:23S rRNA-/tRNA-specific pseudouridylate synthase
MGLPPGFPRFASIPAPASGNPAIRAAARRCTSDSSAPGLRKIVVTPLGKTAETSFTVVSKKKAAALVEAKPLTGRTHQIRAHLAYIGHPVMGDPEFDRKGVPSAPRLMLHAARLAFEHPFTDRPASFAVEPPADFRAFWKSLR